jgi:hypothetical protein
MKKEREIQERAREIEREGELSERTRFVGCKGTAGMD